MSLFRRSIDPRYVPTDPVEVDWSHPLAEALAFLWIPSGEIIARPAFTTQLCGPVQSSVGPAVNFTATSGYVNYAGFSAVTTSDGAGGGDFTVAAAAYLPASLTGANYFFSQRKSAAPINQWGLNVGRDYLNSSSAGTVSFSTYSGTFQGASTAASTSDGLYHVWAGTRTSGVCKIYRDGTDLTSTSASSTQIVYASGQDTTIGDLAQNLNISGIGGHTAPGSYIPFAFAWNRALTQGEATWFSAEPFSMVQPIRRFFPVVNSVVSSNVSLGGTSGVGNVGSFTTQLKGSVAGVSSSSTVGNLIAGFQMSAGPHATGSAQSLSGVTTGPQLRGASATGQVHLLFWHLWVGAVIRETVLENSTNPLAVGQVARESLFTEQSGPAYMNVDAVVREIVTENSTAILSVGGVSRETMLVNTAANNTLYVDGVAREVLTKNTVAQLQAAGVTRELLISDGGKPLQSIILVVSS